MKKKLKFFTALFLAAVIIIGSEASVFNRGYADEAVKHNLTITYMADDIEIGSFTKSYSIGEEVSEAPVIYPESIEFEGKTYIPAGEETSYGTEGMIWESEEDITVTVPYEEQQTVGLVPSVGGKLEEPDIYPAGDGVENVIAGKQETVKSDAKKPEKIKKTPSVSAVADNTVEQVEEEKDVKIMVIGEEEVPLANFGLGPEDHCVLHWLFFICAAVLLVGFGTVNGKIRARIRELKSEIRR